MTNLHACVLRVAEQGFTQARTAGRREHERPNTWQAKVKPWEVWRSRRLRREWKQKNVELDSKRLFAEAKVFYLNLKENQFGRFLAIAEVNRGKRTTVVVPESGLPRLRDLLTEFIEASGSGAGKKAAVGGGADPPEAPEPTNKVNVYNLPFTTTEEELLAAFESHGAKTAFIFRRSGGDGRSHGRGFIVFDSPEVAAKAIADAQDMELGGRKLRFGYNHRA